MTKKNIFNIIMSITLIITFIIFSIINLIRINNNKGDNNSETSNKNSIIKVTDNIIIGNSTNFNSNSNKKNITNSNQDKTSVVDKTSDLDYKSTGIETNEKPFNAIKIDYVPSYNDIFMMCVVVSSETGYCEDKIQLAVAHTIINRVNSDQFPNTIKEVVTQRNQYTAIHSYYDGDYRDKLYPGSDLWNHTWSLCWQALNEEDFIGGAVAYYNPYQKGINPWFEQFTLTYEDEFGRFFVV